MAAPEPDDLDDLEHHILPPPRPPHSPACTSTGSPTPTRNSCWKPSSWRGSAAGREPRDPARDVCARRDAGGGEARAGGRGGPFAGLLLRRHPGALRGHLRGLGPQPALATAVRDARWTTTTSIGTNASFFVASVRVDACRLGIDVDGATVADSGVGVRVGTVEHEGPPGEVALWVDSTVGYDVVWGYAVWDRASLPPSEPASG